MSRWNFHNRDEQEAWESGNRDGRSHGGPDHWRSRFDGPCDKAYFDGYDEARDRYEREQREEREQQERAEELHHQRIMEERRAQEEAKYEQWCNNQESEGK